MKLKLTVTIDEELITFLKKYAKQNYTTMSAVLNQYLASLARCDAQATPSTKKRVEYLESDDVERRTYNDSTKANSFKT
jgi:hypothetical protein